MSDRKRKYPLVQPIEEWAILKISQKRKEIVQEVVRRAIRKVSEDTEEAKMTIEEQLAKTMYMESIRMREEPWNIDPSDEKGFWKSIKKRLIRNEQKEGDGKNLELVNMELLREVVERYGEEIAGFFHIPTFKFARTVLPVLFSRLLNAISAKGMARFFNPTKHIEDKLHITGQIEAIRTLAQKGTVILVPTHSSNLDSILIGWAIDHIGLPPFIYGAGLNLFNNRIVGAFMNRLGAYKVDRRKKNMVYNETLKTFSTVAIQSGTHSLFFPGGTRSRSGALEQKLKLGLLGTAMEAQRLNYVAGDEHPNSKIFVVPLVLCYHFVFEAESLIKQHLHSAGQDKFYIEDEYSSNWKILKFVWNFFAKSSEMELSFGRPMDVLGNFVDNEGISYDNQGRVINTADYFKSRGKVNEDRQRDAEYTRMLGNKIAERFKAENVVFSSHIVAFAGFELLRRNYKELDLYSLLRLPQDDSGVQQNAMVLAIERIITRLRDMEAQKQVRLAAHLDTNAAQILLHGIQHLGLYNDKRPLKLGDDGLLHSDSLSVLHFYYNRLTGYGLEKFV